MEILTVPVKDVYVKRDEGKEASLTNRSLSIKFEITTYGMHFRQMAVLAKSDKVDDQKLFPFYPD